MSDIRKKVEFFFFFGWFQVFFFNKGREKEKGQYEISFSSRKKKKNLEQRVWCKQWMLCVSERYVAGLFKVSLKLKDRSNFNLRTTLTVALQEEQIKIANAKETFINIQKHVKHSKKRRECTCFGSRT